MQCGLVKMLRFTSLINKCTVNKVGCRRTFFSWLWSPPGLRFPHKGQGLVKYEFKPNKNNWSYKFVQRRLKEQAWGKEHFPWLPDIIFISKSFIVVIGIGITLDLTFPWDFFSCTDDYTLVINDRPKPVKTSIAKLYSMLPLRVMSRAWGLISEINIYTFAKPLILGNYAKFFNVNMDEAVVSNIKQYASLQALFTRKIKKETRPVDKNSDVVSPSDGKILYFGKVKNGMVEQIKGVRYSVERFLGPTSAINNKDDKNIEEYEKGLMSNPKDNELYHCIIYLAPGDYHGFHSPVDWKVNHRRHFPGELFSVNPRIAKLKNLFVLNERVVLNGEWKHGFFSMTAVGATNVGSIEIYNDILLKTNRSRKISNGYYDMEYAENKFNLKKGDEVGQFNLGSTVVLIFEAPKNFNFKFDSEILKYGQSIGK